MTTSDDKTIRVWDYDIPVVIKYIAEPTMHSMPAVGMHPSSMSLLLPARTNLTDSSPYRKMDGDAIARQPDPHLRLRLVQAKRPSFLALPSRLSLTSLHRTAQEAFRRPHGRRLRVRASILARWQVPLERRRVGQHGLLGLEDVQDRQSDPGAQEGDHLACLVAA